MQYLTNTYFTHANRTFVITGVWFKRGVPTDYDFREYRNGEFLTQHTRTAEQMESILIPDNIIGQLAEENAWIKQDEKNLLHING